MINLPESNISSRTRSKLNSTSTPNRSQNIELSPNMPNPRSSVATARVTDSRSSTAGNPGDTLNKLGIDLDLSDLSDESQRIVAILLAGFASFMENQLHKKDSENNAKIVKLEKRIEHLEDKLDTLENYGRRESLVLSGPVVSNPSPSRNPRVRDSEDCIDVVSKVVTDHLDINLPKEMISVAHRLGKVPHSGPDNRSIIFRLVRRDLKYSIFKACRSKKPQFSINESVSPLRNTIMYVLRQARKDYPRKFGRNYTEEGNVRLLLPKTEGSDEYEKRTVNTRHDLDELLRVKLNKTSTDFGARWDRARSQLVDQ